MQSVKLNYVKLQVALDSIQDTVNLFTDKEVFDNQELSESFQAALQQYETYYKGTTHIREDWPQLQVVFFSSQPTQIFVKLVEESLSSIELTQVRKIHVIFLRGKNFISSFNTSESKSDTEQRSSQGMFDSEEKEIIIRSLLHVTEIESNSYQLESIIKGWLHDCGTDSDHLRLTVDRLVLRCDLRECLVSPDALPVSGQFFLFPDATPVQQSARVNPNLKPGLTSKVPVYTLESVAVVKKDGLCESLLFGHPIIALATRCWKMDWDELERNQQQFSSMVRFLNDNNLVLLAKRTSSIVVPSEKTLPSAFFAFFPAKNALLIKSVASKELLMPIGNLEEKEISEEAEMEIRECIQKLEEKELYNPMTVASGLYGFLSSSVAKCKPKPATNFIVPTINKKENSEIKKNRPAVPSAAGTSKKAQNISSFPNDFLTASTIYKRKFPNNLE
ncbi:hypothetical protein JTE90_001233 [Oedothorax gibbosus]|uniref:Meiosis 1 arrest protein n=1 Tax=Oedothorax gibbosus TaxID=931172 RepID=A0AAV6UTQ3_9ARAC|nr:hypothetical protein JTE90_001233 [Oedothorax gibbosus]